MPEKLRSYGFSVNFVWTSYCKPAEPECNEKICRQYNLCSVCRLLDTETIVHTWVKVTMMLCLYGTLREIRPSEPFITDFILGNWRNVTEDQLKHNVYPIATYSYVSLLVVVFLVTDLLKFKPIIILSGFSGIAVFGVLQWSSTFQWLQAAQFLFGLYMATEVAYLTYIYAQVDSSLYPVVSSYVHLALIAGKFVSGMTGQVLLFLHFITYSQLNYVTLAAQVLATIWAFWLPSVKYSVYFHQRGDPTLKQTYRSKVVAAAKLMGQHIRMAYRQPRLRAWSALYAAQLALCGPAQAYIQLLWRNIAKTPLAYNGMADVIQTLFSAAGTLGAVYRPRGLYPAPMAAVQCVALFLGTFTPNIFVSYAMYIVLGIMYQYNITLASIRVAQMLTKTSCFGLIFGINTLVGVAIETVLTIFLITVYRVHITALYFVLSVLLMLFSVLWLLGWIYLRPYYAKPEFSATPTVRMDIRTDRPHKTFDLKILPLPPLRTFKTFALKIRPLPPLRTFKTFVLKIRPLPPLRIGRRGK